MLFKSKIFNSRRLLGGQFLSGKIRHWLLFVVAGLVIFVLPNAQLISDTMTGYGYSPTTEMADLRDRIELTERAEVIFKASQPEVQTKQQFNQNCPRKEVTTYILGCYNGQKIFVYQVDNPELDGVNEVTLAHEFLHAVYRRLDLKERQAVNEELVANYRRLKTDELEKRMKMYDRTQPGSFENELHSILGTEFSDLTPKLEGYYQKYLKNRAKIVEFYQKSHKIFADKEAEVQKLKAEIEQAEAQFKADRERYETDVMLINQAVAEFNQRASRGDFASQVEFSTERLKLVARQQSLSARQTELTWEVARINQLIEQYNQTNLAIQELNNSLDSLSSVSGLE